MKKKIIKITTVAISLKILLKDLLLYKKINVSEEKRAKMLWNLYCLEVWKKN